jgi:hypothetical protein
MIPYLVVVALGITWVLDGIEVTLAGSIVGQMMGKIKRFKRIALRCEKTATNYASFLALVSGFMLIKSVHTA